MKLRATLKIRNDRMTTAREAARMTLKQLEEKSGVRANEICKFQRLDYDIYQAENKAVAIAVALGIPTDDVMPEGAAGNRIDSTHVRKFDADAALLFANRQDQKRLPNLSESLEGEEFADAMQCVLRTLTYREREILKLRYGMGEDGLVYTLEETARIFKATRERIRQIEAKAIRKLQHPVRAARLHRFLPGEAL